MTRMMTTHKMTEGLLLVIGDHPVEAAAEVSAEETVEVAKIVVGVERWKETETIHHTVIRILTDGAHSLQHSSCLQVSTVQTRVAGHISSSKKEVKEKYVCSDSLSKTSNKKIGYIVEEWCLGSECEPIHFSRHYKLVGIEVGSRFLQTLHTSLIPIFFEA